MAEHMNKGAIAPLFLKFCKNVLTTLTITTIQAGQAVVHHYYSFCAALVTQLGAFGEAIGGDFFLADGVFFQVFGFFIFHQFLLVLVQPGAL